MSDKVAEVGESPGPSGLNARQRSGVSALGPIALELNDWCQRANPESARHDGGVAAEAPNAAVVSPDGWERRGRSTLAIVRSL